MSTEVQHEQSAVYGAAADAVAPALPGLRGDVRGEAQPTLYVASQWRLMWWRFRKHKFAVAGGIVVILLYLIAAFAEFLAPADPSKVNATYTYAPPQRLHLIRDTPDGRAFGLYVHGYTSTVDSASLRRRFSIDESTVIP